MHSCSPMHPGLTRRQALAGMAGALAIGHTRLAFGAGSGTGPLLIVINVLGGLDGLSAVVPYGDPSLVTLRNDLLPKSLFKIDGFFGLDPNLPNLAGMFSAGEALAVHAVGPIVDTRSHFIGQDFLQGGSTMLTTDGWLNRLLPLLGYSGTLQAGLALGPSAPLAIRGSAPTAGWASNAFPGNNQNLLTLIQTAASNDAALSAAMGVAFQDLSVFSAILKGLGQNNKDSNLVHLAKVAGACLAWPQGPQVAVIETDSVDTHYDQATRLPALLQDLDNAFAAIKTTMGSAWSNTVVLTMTEFGRTAYANGTFGTDHGTGFAVFLAGGPVIGNRVVVDGTWPYLNAPYQGRDLGFTADFRRVAMSVLVDHMGVSAANLQAVFPDSSNLVPLAGLVSG